MAFISIPVRTDGTTYSVATPSSPKIKDIRTGEVATHRETGETLHTVQVLATVDGTADLIKVTVPQSKIPQELTIGTQVRPVNLTANPWVRHDSGNCGDGVTYRADALEPVTAAPSTTPVKAAPAADQIKAAGGAK
ncbi:MULTISPECIES: SCO3933 family regulatory protein [Streptomyces]|uniref:SCO3933 family regulatory protein n=1 Tax=Streptomyces TaxID=1883 RepID=UPI0037F8527D